MSAISKLLAKADKASDYIPFVSTATNLIGVFQKYAIFPCVTRKFIATSPYYHHLDQKSLARSVILLVPIFGNILVYIADSDKGESKTKAAPVDVDPDRPPIPYFSSADDPNPIPYGRVYINRYTGTPYSNTPNLYDDNPPY